MRISAIAVATVAALLLAGCQTGGSVINIPPIPVPSNIADEVSNIQALVQKACGVVPEAVDVISLLSGGSLAGAGAIAEEICTLVAASPLVASASRNGHRHHAPVYVRGVKIRFK